MGKVSRRLTIVVFPPLDEWPEIVKLEEQGHTIVRTTAEGFDSYFEVTPLTEGESKLSNLFKEADLVIGPQCWYFDVKHRKYLTLAIKQARLKRYGKPKKKEADDEKPDSDDLD